MDGPAKPEPGASATPRSSSTARGRECAVERAASIGTTYRRQARSPARRRPALRRRERVREPPPLSDEAPRLRAVRRNAPGKIRTCDLCLRRAALYPLSYGRGEGKSSCATDASPERAATRVAGHLAPDVAEREHGIAVASRRSSPGRPPSPRASARRRTRAARPRRARARAASGSRARGSAGARSAPGPGSSPS